MDARNQSRARHGALAPSTLPGAGVGHETPHRAGTRPPPEPAAPMNTRESVIISAVRTPTGRFLGVLKDFAATELGAQGRSRSSPAVGNRSGDGRRVHHGQRHPGRQRTESGAPGGAQRRPLRPCCRADDQQGVRVGTESRHARGSGHRDWRHRHRGRRRNGIDEQRALPAATRSRRTPDGRRQGRRLADQRRPVVLVRELPHGHVRRSRRGEVCGWARGAGSVRRGEPPQSGACDAARLVQGRDPADQHPAAEGRADRDRRRRTDPGGHDRRRRSRS